ncbi:MAG: DUF177 domain-containing protein [Clostridia bacterium]|nr:DUF177 domain-containing protein [Clostridia bacterium]
MLISLKSLAQCQNNSKPFEYSIDLSEENVNYEFPFQAPIKVTGVITDKSGAVFFDAKAEYTLTVHCARCMKEFTVDKTQEIHYLISTENEEDAEQTEGMYYAGSEEIETDDIIVPDIIMDMDIAFLCSEDCKGLCPKCGCDLNVTTCSCETREVDPRFAKLAELLKK